MIAKHIIFILINVTLVISYSHKLYTIENYENVSESLCGFVEGNPQQEIVKKIKVPHDHDNRTDEKQPHYIFVSQKIDAPKVIDPLIRYEKTFHEVLFGQKADSKLFDLDVTSRPEQIAHFPTGQVMRSETFQGKSSVHLPFKEYVHRSHSYLKMTRDYMQTALNAFAILTDGSLEDVQRLPPAYVLSSARTIAMMKIPREKLAVTWYVVKQFKKPEMVSYETLEKFRPLFKYINAREMARLNLTDKRILSFIGTHPDLNRHQVGVIASRYIHLNPNWMEAKYLNMMNNLLCGVPVTFMRRIPENTYLQLTHQIFYHIRACDPLQRRFYLQMMMKTQALGKSYSWSAREVSRLGLLLAEVPGPDLSAINPEAISGITAQVMSEMPIHNLKFLTEMQLRYLEPKALNIMARKMISYQNEQLEAKGSAATSHSFINLYILCSIILDVL